MRVQINRGDTWEQDGLLEIATGTLAGCTIWLTVKRDPRDPDPGLAQISTDQGGVTILDAHEQRVRFRIEASRTARLPVGEWWWDVQVRLPTGEIETARDRDGVPGPWVFQVLPDITRTT